jgi:hypothetical protein
VVSNRGGIHGQGLERERACLVLVGPGQLPAGRQERWGQGVVLCLGGAVCLEGSGGREVGVLLSLLPIRGKGVPCVSGERFPRSPSLRVEALGVF